MENSTQDLASRLKNLIQEFLPGEVPLDFSEGKKSLEKEVKLLIQEFLSGLDMVSREEFDVQTKVLAKTREKVEDLLAEVEKLENLLEEKKGLS